MSHAGVPLVLRLLQALGWAMFLGLWVMISLKDIKEQRILHRHLLWGAASVLAAYALLGGHSLLGAAGYLADYYRAAFYRDFLAHAAVSAFVAIAMWRAEIWPAGDTKLFILLSWLFPLLRVSGTFHSGWLFLIVLINIFVPAALFVFVQAVRYMWLTRLQHHRGFIASMKLREAFDYVREQSVSRLAALREGAAEGLRGLRADPLSPLRGAAGWGVSIALMALLSTVLKDRLSSPLARTVLCFVLLHYWNKLESGFGKLAPAVVLALAGGLLAASGRSPEFWAEFVRALSSLSLFGIFLFLGARWILGAIGGPMVMFLFPALGLAMAVLPWMLSLRFPQHEWMRTLLVIAGLGGFFGVSLAVVRAWDEEEHPNIPLDKLLSFMMLHPAFVKKLQEDPEFYDLHFSSTYADGLTPEQVEALREWCPTKGIDTIPLTLTSSFAPWIFLGYFITWLLGGHVLRSIL